MTYTLTVYTTVYGPWQEGDDEPTILQDDVESTQEFDHLREAADWLEREGLTSPSSHPRVDERTWLCLVDGTRGHGSDAHYTGNFERVTAHRGAGFTDREWIAVVESVKW